MIQIGKRYSVPCVRTARHKGVWQGDILPVLLPAHEDTEILKFQWFHYHVDWRFVAPAIFERIRLVYEPSSYENFINGIPITMDQAAGEPFIRRLKCYRDAPVFPLNVPWSPALEAHYTNKRMSKMTCPHRGIALKGRPCEQDGGITCPGHGLKWNATTGEMMKRTTLDCGP